MEHEKIVSLSLLGAFVLAFAIMIIIGGKKIKPGKTKQQ